MVSLLAAVLEHDRQADMVGIGAHDLPQPGRVEVFVLTLAQMNDDRRAARQRREAARW